MAVNLRKKYSGNKEVSKKNRAYRYQSGLSNKKWDKTIKGLTKNKLASVNKTDEGLFVEAVVPA